MKSKINKEQHSNIKELLNTLVCDDGMKRKAAREELVKIGSDTIDYLMEYVNHSKHIYRWEALKTMSEIADPISIPFFIDALEDDESDIRWIAAEGLINIGPDVLIPLLKAIIERINSLLILEGAHHVIYDLKKKKGLPKEFPTDKFLATIKRTNSDEAIKLLAFHILSKLEN